VVPRWTPLRPAACLNRGGSPERTQGAQRMGGCRELRIVCPSSLFPSWPSWCPYRLSRLRTFTTKSAKRHEGEILKHPDPRGMTMSRFFPADSMRPGVAPAILGFRGLAGADFPCPPTLVHKDSKRPAFRSGAKSLWSLVISLHKTTAREAQAQSIPISATVSIRS
jgi:hypothetical protein